MSSPRPVRISRPEAAGSTSGDVRRAAFTGGWVPNRAGEMRAARLFVLYVIGIVAIYVAFIGLAEAGPNAEVRSAPIAWGTFSLLALAFAAWGWAITYGRTPRGAQRRDADILVRERLGRVRRFPADVAAAPRVLQHYDAGFLGPAPSEMVELLTRERRRRTYVVGERFFEQLASA